MDLPVARQRAEVARVALHHLVAVGERAPVVAGEEIRGGALVPALRESGFALDDVAEDGDGLRNVPGLHQRRTLGEGAVDAGVARTAPQQPERLLGERAHQEVFIPQAAQQQRLVGHASVLRKPDDRFGTVRRVGMRQSGDNFRTIGGRIRGRRE